MSQFLDRHLGGGGETWVTFIVLIFRYDAILQINSNLAYANSLCEECEGERKLQNNLKEVGVKCLVWVQTILASPVPIK